MISTGSMVCMVVAGLIAFGLPIGLFIYFLKAKKAEVLPFFVGCLVMLLFAFTLEQLAHAVILGSAAGAVIQNNIWLYGLYGGLMAGLFEETGRLVAFRTLLKKKQSNNANALMYGAGHGGFEAMVLLGITSINNLVYSALINSGAMDELMASMEGDTLAATQSAVQTLISTPWWQFLMGGVERILAVILQIALSVLVWFAVKEKKYALYLQAILIHLLVDAGTVVLSKFGLPLPVLELIVAAGAMIAAWYAGRVWKSGM